MEDNTIDMTEPQYPTRNGRMNDKKKSAEELWKGFLNHLGSFYGNNQNHS